MSVGDILSRVGTMLGGAGPSTSGGASGSGRPNRELSYGEKKANAKETLPWEYLNGYKSLTTVQKDAFRDLFGADIDAIKDIDTLDNYFKNMIFTLLYKNRQDEEGKLIWENRKSYSRNQRDIFVGRALNELLEALTSNRNMVGSLIGIGTPTLVGRYRELVNSLLQNPAARRANQLFDYMQSLDEGSKKKLVTLFDDIASQLSNLYKEYKDDDDRINFSDSEKLRLLAEFLANSDIGGGLYAGRGLYNSIADELASNLGFFEKIWNAGNLFVNSFAGDIITAVGMAVGAVYEGASALTGNGHSDWWKTILNNDITTYGELLAETNTWDPAEQKRLSELGLNDNPIFSSAAELELLLSWNTPFELGGSSGYTVGSTVLSGMSAKAITGLPKVYRALKGATKMTKTASGILKLEKASLYTRTMQRMQNITLKSVPAFVGTTEGAMNAGLTYREVLRDKTNLVYENVRNKAYLEIEQYVRNNPGGVAEYYKSKGYNIPMAETKNEDGGSTWSYSDDTIDQLISIALLDEDLVNLTMARHSQDLLEDLNAAEKSADLAMAANFILNSFINGALNYATKLTLMSPTIRKAFSKNVNANKLLEEHGIDLVTGSGSVPKAVAKKYTKMDAIKRRTKEMFGEGAEEGLLTVSSAFSEGYGSNMFNSYLHNKYVLNQDAQLALETSFLANMAYGSREALDAMVSMDTWRDALYGGLSIALGMPQPKASSMYGKSDELSKADKNLLLKVADKIPFGYRSLFAPLFNNTEVNAVNKQRKEVEDYINRFLLKQGTAESLFNVANTAKFIESKEKAARDGDEMSYRDAEFGELFSLATTLNTLEGTDYYDSVITMLWNTAKLNEEDLADPNSLTSQAVAEYQQFAKENYGTEVDNNEALLAVKSNASKLLSTIEQAKAEYRNVEKMFGENLDADVKLGIVYQRLASLDHKKRLELLLKELSEVAKLLQTEDGEFASLSLPILKLLALNGSISNAKEAAEALKGTRKEIDDQLKQLKELKSVGLVSKQTYNRQKKALLRRKQRLNNEINFIEDTIDDYTSKYGTINEDGTVNTPESLVLSAATIMQLDPESRAIMLDEKNRNEFSEAQLLEIDKVNRIGVLTFQDFLEKIADSGALAIRYENSLEYLLLMMRDKELYAREANRFKTNALAKLLERLYSYLIDLEAQGRYEEFARAIDKIIGSGDVVALKAVDGLLLKTKSEFYKRYSNERNNLDRLIADLSNGNIKSFKDLDDNSQRMFSMTLLYLLNKGIDLNDTDAVVAALSELDAEGNTLFKNYIDSFYPEKDNTIYVNRVEFTSTGEVILNYKNVMLEYNAQLKERASNAKPTEVASTPQSKSAPPAVPSATERFQSLGTPTADEGTQRDMKALEEGVVEDPVTLAYKTNSGEKIAELSKFSTNVINNSSTTTHDAESKELAIQLLARLSDTKFETPLDFINAIAQSANKLRTESENDNDANSRAAALLTEVAAKVQNRVDSESSNQTRPETTLRTLENFGRRGSTVLMGPTVNVNSNLLQTLPIAWMRRNFPNHPIVKYYDTYKIEEFLASSLMPSNPTVMFISDLALAAAVEEDFKLKNDGSEYSAKDIPLIAVIEVPSGGIIINVDGTDKHFLPIGVMPSTGNENMSGSNRLGKIRELIDLDNMGQLLRDELGNIITTTIYGLIKFDSPRHIPITYPNREVSSVLISDASYKDRKLLEVLSKSLRRNHSTYQSLRQRFLSGLKTKLTSKGAVLYYPVDNPFGPEPFDITIWATPIHLTRAKNSNTLISELFNSNDVEATLKANSRLKRAASSLYEFFKTKFSTADLEFKYDASGAIVPSESTAKKLASLAEELGRDLSNYLRLPGEGGWKYVISPTSKVMKNGRRVFSLSIVNSNGATILLGNVTLGDMTVLTLFNILKNLIMDGSSVRMESGKNSFIKWNVPYRDFLSNDTKAKDNAVDIYNDGILSVSYESFKFLVKNLVLNSPFTLEGSSNYTLSTLVSNLDNALTTTLPNLPASATSDLVITLTGGTVASDSGAVVLKSGQLRSSGGVDTMSKVLDSAKEGSSLLLVSPDGRYYVNTKTGKKYNRVTEVDQSDPSSIEASISELTRDFITGNLKDSYPNVSPQLYQSIKEKLEQIRNHLDTTGMTIVPSNIIPAGVIDIEDSEGNRHFVHVAMQSGFLVLDPSGNIHLYSISTADKKLTEKRKKSIRALLSLYKNLLLQQYDINVKSINIFPITNVSSSPSVEGALLVKPMRDKFIVSNLPDFLRDLVLQDTQIDSSPLEINGVEDLQLENQVYIDPLTNMTKTASRDLREGRDSGTPYAEKPTRSEPIPERLQWGRFEGYTVIDETTGELLPIDVAATIEELIGAGYTQEKWNNMSDEEMEDALNCTAV